MESQGRSAQHGGACARAAHAHNVSTWRGVSIAPALVASGRLLELERQTSASLIPEHLLTGKWYWPHRDESAGTFQTPAGRQLLFVSPAASASAQARHQFSATAFRGTSHGLRGRPLHSRAVRTAERDSRCRRRCCPRGSQQFSSSRRAPGCGGRRRLADIRTDAHAAAS